ncbi:MAG: hypothetical protein KY476_02990 [Planctomycetes bacterium]|nr:hypothetical protein [Planctomycetota bacterium]
MPRARRLPAYRRHKARDLAVATLDGRDRYLGEYGTAYSYRRYLDVLASQLQAESRA